MVGGGFFEGDLEAGKNKSSADKENIVKNHLTLIVLSILCEKPMCGYDLIKEILARYNVFISQGTVYGLLYSLKDEGIIQAEFKKGNMKAKRYCITENGRYIIGKKINDFINAEESILNSIKKD